MAKQPVKTESTTSMEPVTDQPSGGKKPATYLVNARYELPRFGGIPYPAGLNFFGFVTFQIKEAKPGAGIAEKVVLKAAEKEVLKLKHQPTGLVIEGFSELPEGW